MEKLTIEIKEPSKGFEDLDFGALISIDGTPTCGGAYKHDDLVKIISSYMRQVKLSNEIKCFKCEATTKLHVMEVLHQKNLSSKMLLCEECIKRLR